MKVLLLADIHGNWPALQAALAAEPDADQILCLGDLVGYGPQPVECVTWAMQLKPPSRVIQGNHDRAFGLSVAPQCAPANQPLAEAMQSATSHLLTPEMRRFLATLRPLQEFDLADARCVAFHAMEPVPRGSPIGEVNPHWSWETDIVLRGHPDKLFVLIGHPDVLFLSDTHAPIQTHWGDTLVVNPGSVGWPTESEGAGRAAYAVWGDGEVMFRAAAYDVEETVRAFDALKLEEDFKHRLAERLRTGTCSSRHTTGELATAR